MSHTPPLMRLPDRLRRDLEKERTGLADELEQTLAARVRPCIAVTSSRVSRTPLQRGLLATLLGKKPSAPILPPTASKFGGAPYCEVDEDWEDFLFLGQVELAEATAVLPPGSPPLKGLLRVDVRGSAPLLEPPRVQWFPMASAERAVPAFPKSYGSWEARMRFNLAWKMPDGEELTALWPLRDVEWFDYGRFFPPGYIEHGEDRSHWMLGYRVDPDIPFTLFPPPAGCSTHVEDYECLWRITYDHEADFAWGSHSLYLLVLRDDLHRGDLSRVAVAVVNG